MFDRNVLEELAERHLALVSDPPGRLRCEALPHLRRIVCLDPGAEGATRLSAVEGIDELLAMGADVSPALLDAAAEEVHPADDGVLIYTSGTTAHPKGVLHMQRAPVIQSWRFAEDMALGPDDIVLTAQPFFNSPTLAT